VGGWAGDLVDLLSTADRHFVSGSLEDMVAYIHENYVDVSSDSEMGNVKENLIINLEGKDLTIAFNSRYLIDCLRCINDEFINFNLNSPISPCVIKPYSDDEYLYLILPVRMTA
ncbi:MAG: DNA polymerase III subunit beta, partial [Clostridia bacterium]|nr:DNA polymerase III subunit beta [Clostridia bacterium]